MPLNSNRSVSEVELSAEMSGCKAKVAKAVELPSKFIPEWCLQFVIDVWTAKEMRLDFFPCAERSGKKQPHQNKVLLMFGAVSHRHTATWYQSRILSTDCGWSDVSSVRIFSSHLKPSLSLRFPLQEAWTIGRSSMSSCS